MKRKPNTENISAWLNLVQADLVVTEAVQSRLEQRLGISVAEHELLVRLRDSNEGKLKMVDLSSLLLVSKSGVTRLVDRMEKSGLVARESSRPDRRVIYASMTPKGRKLLEKADPIFLGALETHFSAHLSEPDVKALRRILRKLLTGNGKWEEVRCTVKTGAKS